MQEDLLREIELKTSRASGPGGQHVNKTESRVELHWNIQMSSAVNADQKAWILSRIGHRFTEQGDLRLICQRSRSQLKNRQELITRFLRLIEMNSHPPTRRIATKPSRASKERRLKAKRIKSERKQGRGPVRPED